MANWINIVYYIFISILIVNSVAGRTIKRCIRSGVKLAAPLTREYIQNATVECDVMMFNATRCFKMLNVIKPVPRLPPAPPKKLDICKICGVAKQKEERFFAFIPTIIGGEDASKGEYPWYTYILSNYSNGNESSTGSCGGSIISSTVVLTAAHCVANAVWVRVELGRTHYNVPEPDTVVVYAKEVIVHHNYSDFYYDIAIIRIMPIEFNHKIHPICLPSQDDENLYIDKTALIIGTGVTEQNENENLLKPILQEGNVTIISNEKCSAIWQDVTSITTLTFPDDILCAFDNITSGCLGDSGGPISVKDKNGVNFIVGMTSFGQIRCTDAPVVYTRISSYLEWIHSYVYDLNCNHSI